MINLLQSFLESTLSSKSPDQCSHLTQSCKIWWTPTQLYIFTQVLRPFTAKNNESDLQWLNVPRDAVLPPGPAQDCTASTSTRWPITNYLQLLYCWIRFILIIILLFIISFSLTWLDIDIHQFRFVIVFPCKQCHFPQLSNFSFQTVHHMSNSIFLWFLHYFFLSRVSAVPGRHMTGSEV